MSNPNTLENVFASLMNAMDDLDNPDLVDDDKDKFKRTIEIAKTKSTVAKQMVSIANAYMQHDKQMSIHGEGAKIIGIDTKDN